MPNLFSRKLSPLCREETLGIECHFAALKKFALASSDFRTHEEQRESIEDYLLGGTIVAGFWAPQPGQRSRKPPPMI
jgi:hypothetical protein